MNCKLCMYNELVQLQIDWKVDKFKMWWINYAMQMWGIIDEHTLYVEKQMLCQSITALGTSILEHNC